MFKYNRLISYLLLFCFVFSFFTCGRVESSAADGTENLTPSDFDIYAEMYIGTEGDFSAVDVSDSLLTGTRFFENTYFTMYAFPNRPSDKKNLMTSLYFDEDFSFNSSHEYHLSFIWSHSVRFPTVCQVSLNFYNGSGELIKEQILYGSQCQEDGMLLHNVDIDFKPDTSDITSGYNCYLNILLMQTGDFPPNNDSIQSFYLSNEIIFEDKDDDSGWFQKILNAIKALPDNIKSFFDNLGIKIDALGDKIGSFFTELGENILEGIKSLFIPSDGYFETKLDEMDVYCTDHLGALYQAPQTMIHFIGLLINLEPEQPAITMPAIEFMWEGELITLTEPIEYTFEWINDSSHPLFYFYKFYRGFVTLMLLLFFVNYCKHKYEKVFGGV